MIFTFSVVDSFIQSEKNTIPTLGNIPIKYKLEFLACEQEFKNQQGDSCIAQDVEPKRQLQRSSA